LPWNIFLIQWQAESGGIWKGHQMSELLEKIRIELEKALTGRPYLFRTDKTRQALDGNSAGVMANFDSAGIGPKGAFFIGRKIAYPTVDYIEWVCSRISHKVKRCSQKGP
jgi:hypothetical protein